MTEPRPLFEALNDPAPADDHFECCEIPVTRAHRERAAGTLSEIGHQVEVWIETGGVDPLGGPFNDQLFELAQAFADFEHELLLCPTTIVHGMDESEEVCTLCGTSPEDFHTIRDCFRKYKQAQDDAANQVTAYLQEKNTELEKEVERLKALVPKESLPFHVFWDEDSVWVVARDCEDAALVYSEHVGDGCETHETLQFSRCNDDMMIRIKCYTPDHPDAFKIAGADEEGAFIMVLGRHASDWAERIGRGFLCTTDF